jgi:hypothetical protein
MVAGVCFCGDALLVRCECSPMKTESFLATQRVARILRGGKPHAAAIKLLRAKYPQYRKVKLDTRPVIETAVKRVVQWKARKE